MGTIKCSAWSGLAPGEEFSYPHAEHELGHENVQLLDSGVSEPTLIISYYLTQVFLSLLSSWSSTLSLKNTRHLLLTKLQDRQGGVDRLKGRESLFRVNPTPPDTQSQT